MTNPTIRPIRRFFYVSLLLLLFIIIPSSLYYHESSLSGKFNPRIVFFDPEEYIGLRQKIRKQEREEIENTEDSPLPAPSSHYLADRYADYSKRYFNATREFFISQSNHAYSNLSSLKTSITIFASKTTSSISSHTHQFGEISIEGTRKCLELMNTKIVSVKEMYRNFSNNRSYPTMGRRTAATTSTSVPASKTSHKLPRHLEKWLPYAILISCLTFLVSSFVVKSRRTRNSDTVLHVIEFEYPEEEEDLENALIKENLSPSVEAQVDEIMPPRIYDIVETSREDAVDSSGSPSCKLESFDCSKGDINLCSSEKGGSENEEHSPDIENFDMDCESASNKEIIPIIYATNDPKDINFNELNQVEDQRNENLETPDCTIQSSYSSSCDDHNSKHYNSKLAIDHDDTAENKRKVIQNDAISMIIDDRIGNNLTKNISHETVIHKSNSPMSKNAVIQQTLEHLGQVSALKYRGKKSDKIFKAKEETKEIPLNKKYFKKILALALLVSISLMSSNLLSRLLSSDSINTEQNHFEL